MMEPNVMLKHGELVFLDDMSVGEVAQKLNTTIFLVANQEELIKTCIKN